jgi:hypothetical protein
MPTLSIEIYQSLMDALVARCQATGEPLRHLVSRALSDALGLDHATLFQISTGTALVEGVHDKAITVGDLRSHGDFGLGTFEGLDGEMVVLDGHFYQAHFDGRITEAPDSAAVPFAVVTNFSPQHRASLSAIGSIDALTAALDGLRRSQKSLLRGSPRRPPSPSFTCGLPARCRPARRSSKPRTASRVPSRPAERHPRRLLVAGLHPHGVRCRLALPLPVGRPQQGRPSARLQGGASRRPGAGSRRFPARHARNPQFLRADFTRDPSAALDEAERAAKPTVPPSF